MNADVEEETSSDETVLEKEVTGIVGTLTKGGVSVAQLLSVLTATAKCSQSDSVKRTDTNGFLPMSDAMGRIKTLYYEANATKRSKIEQTVQSFMPAPHTS